MLATRRSFDNWIITMILIECVYCHGWLIWDTGDESQGSQESGSDVRHRPLRQGGRTDLREPTHAVGPTQEARGLSRRQAVGAPTKERAAHRGRQAGRGAGAAHVERRR